MDTNLFIDELLSKFKKCDVFTPDKISKMMSDYLYGIFYSVYDRKSFSQ
jgi:hypothetical protein